MILPYAVQESFNYTEKLESTETKRENNTFRNLFNYTEKLESTETFFFC